MHCPFFGNYLKASDVKGERYRPKQC